MNFGIQLPGPFRIGISSKGRTSLGVALGPVSISTSGSRHGSSGAPILMRTRGTIAQAADSLRRDGWKVHHNDPRIATASWRMSAVQIEQVTHDEIEIRQITSRVKLLFWALVVVAAVTAYELLT